MADTVKQYLITLDWIDKFEAVRAEAMAVPETKRSWLWRAEVTGYESVLADLQKEARTFEREHIRIPWSKKDNGFIATSDEFGPTVSAFGESYEEALKELRVALTLVVESEGEDHAVS